ncbi:MAG TPA: anti-sigma F factor [Candidatus Borkfalkia faecavium]|uniref:Anti-sigma F factor n=1 Tax=Candidatus Borkfalkia faecavium TaxID=2838508 RepID=A0A9D1W243_9FIRM|nr:anti-sigma F factor [Candidatus Borkfalkia faecavium]
MENCMKLTVPAISENEPFVRDAVAAFCVRLDPTLDQLSDIKTAVSEAVTNCIVHAYAGGEGEIEVECAARDGALHIRISDSGRGIEDVARALEPFFTTLEGDERSGMGFTIMQTFMSEFSVRSAPGEGTVVTMKKQISPAVRREDMRGKVRDAHG